MSMVLRGVIRRCLIVAAVLLAVCTGAFAQAPAPVEADARTSDTVVGKAYWGDVTLAEIQKFYSIYLYPTNTLNFEPKVDPAEVFTMPADWLEKLATTYAIAKASELAADKLEDAEVKENFQRQLNGWLMNFVLPEVDKRLVLPKAAEPTEEEIAAYYQRNQPLYFQPFQFSMRHIFLMTYEPYVLKKNETIDGVAQRLLGDKARAKEILSDVPGRPERWVPLEERRTRFFKPESEGERVLIPMSPEKIEEVRRKMEKIRERAHAGEDFVKLAIENSQAEIRGEVIGPLPSGISEERMLQYPIIEAAIETPKDGISKVIPTRHGYHLIQVVNKREEKVRRLEEVRAEIRQTMLDAQREEFRVEAVRELLKIPIDEINMENFALAPNLSEDTVMLKVGAHPFAWKEIEPTWRKFIGPGATREQIIHGMQNNTAFIHALMLKWADSIKLWESPEYADTFKYMRTGVYGLALNRMEMDQTVNAAVTPEALQKYYDERKESDYYRPLQATFQIMARRVDPAKAGDPQEMERMRVALESELARIGSINSFINLAKETNPRAEKGKPWAQLAPKEIALVGGPTGEQLKNLKSGQWSGAYIEGDTVRSVGMIERMESRHLSLTEVKREIAAAISKRVEGEMKGILEQHWLRDSNFEFLLPKPASSNPKPAESPQPATP